ncbi:hypothetical protein [Thermoplasma sp.]|uniref:hypothetical protein n=1 Tax=Thermoplasma sp. TaxID=1973142 RepID=UPI0025CF96F9|nr:hypothetical protein [Thermoplasma sp.]
MEEESLIESFVKALEGTKGTVEFSFEDLSIKLPGMNASMLINGKVNVTAMPVNEKPKQ